jgi:hypothetical protein
LGGAQHNDRWPGDASPVALSGRLATIRTADVRPHPFIWTVCLHSRSAGSSGRVWGSGALDPAPTPGKTGSFAKLSWREKLTSFAHSREAILLFGAILPLALLTRLLFLGAKSFDEDEMFSVFVARNHLPDFWNKMVLPRMSLMDEGYDSALRDLIVRRAFEKA